VFASGQAYTDILSGVSLEDIEVYAFCVLVVGMMLPERCSMFTFDGCWRDTVRGGRCLFHLEEKTKAEADLFEQTFFPELERIEEGVSPYIDFSRFIFPRSVCFSNHVFHRVVLFDETVFEREVYFTGCTFDGQVSFEKTKFKGRVFFESTFEGRVHFFQSKFEQGADFSKVVFKASIYPRVTDFVF
jgi:hypothetical protein